jgi:hypothetical protein
MFDPVTAAFLQTAPAMPQLDPQSLPQMLTARYAELVARRLRQAEGGEVSEPLSEHEWSLSRIADAYELVTSIHEDPNVRRAAAFVAATAQQILAQELVPTLDAELSPPVLHRDGVAPSLAAAILFLVAEQYADANEAAQRIRINEGRQHYVATLLAEDIQDLASGRLNSILSRAGRRPEHFTVRGDLEERGTVALFESLIVGIELFAAEILAAPIPVSAAGRFENARDVFSRVLELSTYSHDAGVVPLLTTYPGPRHLAALLLSAYDATFEAAVTRINPPPGVDVTFWRRWIRHRAATAPFMWQNHREAVAKGFHAIGTSAVVVLPTGAGKTTVSCLKIASVLANGKSVIFIAPTHALVEQLTTDLQAFFPEEMLGSLVSSDFDRPFTTGTTLRKIEVMTPEHCLALLSYAPHAFADVGLMVFDECHLLSPVSGLRRALDGMFCVLAFNSIAPVADFLFLSAMIRNGAEFAEWIAALTGRECVFVDPLWKPSRQARGVVIYKPAALKEVLQAALETQKTLDKAQGKRARTLRKAAKEKLSAQPFALFGLQHNWLHVEKRRAECKVMAIAERPIELGGKLQGARVVPMPNVNGVAAHLAAASVRNGLKTIVFVNVKAHAVSTARAISERLGAAPAATADETERWQALEAELGGLEHSLLPGPSTAVPHNSQMLRLERDIAERMFQRPDGAQVIVATPTLAQGLNLPAHIAILASDMRADPEDGGRTALGAHELLNAAARAGRAGHLANGVVLLIPEEILTFSEVELTGNAVGKLKSILPEDDRCLEVSDPLQVVLDRISTAETADVDLEYALNRLSTAVAPEGAEITEAVNRFAVDKSFAAFMASKRNHSEMFTSQIAKLNSLLAERNPGTDDALLLELAAQSGASVAVLRRLRERLAAVAKNPPATILDWVSWIFSWLAEDDESRLSLLDREKRTILGAVGRKGDSPLSADALNQLLPGVNAWLTGRPLSEIERALGGDPKAKPECPRARHVVTSLVPLCLTFIGSLVARMAKEIPEIVSGQAVPRHMSDLLPTAVRRGFDDPAKLAFSEVQKGLLSRVQYHRAYAAHFGNSSLLEGIRDYAEIVAVMRRVLQSDED